MERSFSYKGVHLGKLGVQWAPVNNEWDIWDSGFSVREKQSDSQSGGQWYGVSVQPKEFKLPCFFKGLTERDLEYIRWLMSPGESGELVFDERPFVKYEARVVTPPSIAKFPTGNGGLNGTIILTMRAYYPYGTTGVWSLEDATTYGMTSAELKSKSEIIALADMPVETEVSPSSPATAQFIQDYYHGGTAPAETIIKIAGNAGDGVTIYSQATGQCCRVIGLTNDNTTTANKWLEIRSKTGEVLLTDGTTEEVGYLHHARGYVQMAPGLRDETIYAISYDGSDVQATGDVFRPYHVGMHILADGAWRKIVSVTSSKAAVIDTQLAGTGTAKSLVAPMNRIVVTPDSDMSLTKFEIGYAHTFK